VLTIQVDNSKPQKTRLRLSSASCWILVVGSWLFFSSCRLFDDTQLQQQRAELERLKQESAQLQQEAQNLQQQQQKAVQEREACNRAYPAFSAARKAPKIEEAVDLYREGLTLCPSDDVAHNELGELYLRLGRKPEAAAEFEEALRINPNFPRAQKNLDSTREGG